MARLANPAERSMLQVQVVVVVERQRGKTKQTESFPTRAEQNRTEQKTAHSPTNSRPTQSQKSTAGSQFAPTRRSIDLPRRSVPCRHDRPLHQLSFPYTTYPLDLSRCLRYCANLHQHGQSVFRLSSCRHGTLCTVPLCCEGSLVPHTRDPGVPPVTSEGTWSVLDFLMLSIRATGPQCVLNRLWACAHLDVRKERLGAVLCRLAEREVLPGACVLVCLPPAFSAQLRVPPLLPSPKRVEGKFNKDVNSMLFGLESDCCID